MSHPRPAALGPRAGRLLAGVELRLAARAVFGTALAALAAVILLLEILALLLAFGPPALAGLAERLGRALPVLAPLAAAGALLPLLRRPSRVYLAALAEKVRPELAGSLVALAEEEAGRAALAEGVRDLLAERVEAVLAAFRTTAGQVAARERRRLAAPAFLAAVLAAGLALAAAAPRRYRDALGELAGLGGAGPTRLVEVQPGDVELDEGRMLAVECRLAGREPLEVAVLLGADPAAVMSRAGDGLWRATLRPEAASYRILVAARDGALPPSRPYSITIRPRPLARVAKVVYRYPEYTGLAPRESDSPELDCLAGANAEVWLETRGAVGGVELRLEPGAAVPAQRLADGRWRARLTVARVGAYSVWVSPAGRSGPDTEVFRGTITARADLPPTAAALARALPDGRVAVDYRVADDYRLGPARMTFTVDGRRLAYEVPDVAGRRTAQGAVLVPKEVLAAAADGFRYRIEAADTHAPEPHRTVGAELQYRPERPPQLAMTGPLLEKRQPLQMAGSHQRPGSADGGGGSPAGQTTRPLESLYKPGEDEGRSSGGAGQKPGNPDDPYLAPPGGDAGEEPPEKKNPDGNKEPGNPGEGQKPPEGGPGGQPQAPEPPPPVNTPKPGGAGDTVNTPGGRSSGGGGGGGGESGGNGGGEKPPTGNETGVGTARPETIDPEKVKSLDLKPGEERTPRGGRPPALRTDFGQARLGRPAPGAEPAEARAPDGSLRTAGPAPAEPAKAGPGQVPDAPVAPQYRRYVNEYLGALSEQQ